MDQMAMQWFRSMASWQPSPIAEYEDTDIPMPD
jgi:hypothetical protein